MRAKCRCGQDLEIPEAGSHVVCPKCSAKARLVRKPRPGEASGRPDSDNGGDGYVRFPCSCGRKLKVSVLERPTHGKCPACGAVVPVPEGAMPSAHGDAPTADMPAADRELLEAWTRNHLGARKTDVISSGSTQVDVASAAATATATASPPRPPAIEAGLRICPKCGKPIHMGADRCRTCGIVVPRR